MRASIYSKVFSQNSSRAKRPLCQQLLLVFLSSLFGLNFRIALWQKGITFLCNYKLKLALKLQKFINQSHATKQNFPLTITWLKQSNLVWPAEKCAQRRGEFIPGEWTKPVQRASSHSYEQSLNLLEKLSLQNIF